MTTPDADAPRLADALARCGLPRDSIDEWIAQRPDHTTSLDADRGRFGRWFALGAALLGRLPARPKRSGHERIAAEALLGLSRDARRTFLAAHALAVYDELTGARSSFVRLDALCAAAAQAFPGLVPDRATLGREAPHALADKDGHEVDQGLFASALLAHPDSGRHLCHAMLLPLDRSREALAKFEREGVLELAGARLERHGRAAHVVMRHPRFLNAEDMTTLEGFETAVDCALLDARSEVCVLRGDTVTHTKYAGRRVFGAGINLTHLYHGRVDFLFYLLRDLGVVNKIFRGLARPELDPDEIHGETTEKLWVAAVDAFAIGGHCQLLLVMDHVIAENDAYLSLPARKEGIIPGAANLRLPRFVGNRIARQAILSDRRLPCASPEGRLICDELVATGALDAAIDARVALLTDSGLVSAAGNRRAFRVDEEPLDAFRRYMAVYAREQAWCHFSPTLVANLEKHWNAGSRKP